MKVGLLIPLLLLLFGCVNGAIMHVQQFKSRSNGNAHKLKRELDYNGGQGPHDSGSNVGLTQQDGGVKFETSGSNLSPDIVKNPNSAFFGEKSQGNPVSGAIADIPDSKLRRLAEDVAEEMIEQLVGGGSQPEPAAAPAKPVPNPSEKIISEIDSFVKPHVDEADYQDSGSSGVHATEADMHPISHDIVEHHWPEGHPPPPPLPAVAPSNGQPHHSKKIQEKEIQQVHLAEQGSSGERPNIPSGENVSDPGKYITGLEGPNANPSGPSVDNTNPGNQAASVKTVEEVPQAKSDTGLLEPNRTPLSAVNIQEPNANDKKEPQQAGPASLVGETLKGEMKQKAGEMVPLPFNTPPPDRAASSAIDGAMAQGAAVGSEQAGMNAGTGSGPGQQAPARGGESASPMGTPKPMKVQKKGAAGSSSLSSDAGSGLPSNPQVENAGNPAIPSPLESGNVPNGQIVNSPQSRRKREILPSSERMKQDIEDRQREFRYNEGYANENAIDDTEERPSYRDQEPYNEPHESQWNSFNRDLNAGSPDNQDFKDFAADWKDSVPEKISSPADNLVPFAGAMEHLKALQMIESCFHEYLHSERVDTSKVSDLLLEPKVVSYIKDCYYSRRNNVMERDVVNEDLPVEQPVDQDKCIGHGDCPHQKVHGQKRNENPRLAEDYFHNSLGPRQLKPAVRGPIHRHQNDPGYQSYRHSPYAYPSAFGPYGKAESMDASSSHQPARPAAEIYPKHHHQHSAASPPRDHQPSHRQHQKFGQGPYRDFYPLSDRPQHLPASSSRDFYHVHPYGHDHDEYHPAHDYNYLNTGHST